RECTTSIREGHQIKKFKTHFYVRRIQVVKAVDGVTLHVNKCENLELVGESGCGKSTIGRTIMGLYEKTEGDVIFEGKAIHDLDAKEKYALYRQMQMIFQDPYASLNPRSTVKEIIAEPMEVH